MEKSVIKNHDGGGEGGVTLVTFNSGRPLPSTGIT